MPLSVFNNDAGFVTTAGDAFLANTQTFTGVNTFNNAAGGIQVSKITGVGNTDTFIEFETADTINLTANNNELVQITSNPVFNAVTINPNNNDVNFAIYKQTTGTALSYDAATDTLDFGAANITGVASSDTGTWSPAFLGAGTLGTVTGTYTKTGGNVICHCIADVDPGLGFNVFSLTVSTLPFTPSTDRTTFGTYFTAANDGATTAATTGVMYRTGTSILLMNNSTNTRLTANLVLGYLAFTLTYRTDD